MGSHMLTQSWRGRIASLLFAAGIAALFCFLPGGRAARAESSQAALAGPNPASCGFEWAYYGAGVPHSSGLRDITAIAADDVWAVGTQYETVDEPFPLLKHWDGSQWSVETPPEIEGAVNRLEVVSAIASDNVWAFGSSGTEDVVPVHWDGISWSTQPGPGIDFYLNDGVAISDSDIWLVGYRVVSGNSQSYATHWDGTTWNTMFVPGGVHSRSDLTAVTAIAPDDIWVTGFSQDEGILEAFVSHWDGTNWTPSTLPMNTIEYLEDIDASAGDDVWAVGRYTDTKSHGIVLHWDGVEWTEAPAPDTSPMAVVALAPYDVWVLGTGEFIRAAHYNGYKWAASPGPSPFLPLVYMDADGIASGELWVAATGYFSGQTTGRIAHYRETFASYADVAGEDELFPYITCLSCAGIVNGYPCGGEGEPCNANNDPYFRPAASVTRGQIAKIVASAAGLGGSPSSQAFEDVPPGSTFHTYIENLAALEVMSGYACGGTNEPCVPPDNRPYFRPNATASRGQLAKIASNAAEFNEPIPPGTQTFADAPEGSPFHPYIERLAARGVMQGYPCGGPGEPCDEESRPYFRPGSSVTRGQTTKIAANTFLLNCPSGEPR